MTLTYRGIPIDQLGDLDHTVRTTLLRQLEADITAATERNRAILAAREQARVSAILAEGPDPSRVIVLRQMALSAATTTPARRGGAVVPQPRQASPRGTCPECHLDVATRADGTPRRHPDLAGGWCPGTTQPARTAPETHP